MADYDLGLWTRQSLPILAPDLQRHRQIIKDERRSFVDLAMSISRDPVAVQHLYRESLKSLQARKDNLDGLHPKSLEQVLGILGQNGVSKALDNLPVLDESSVRSERLQCLLAQSLLAAELAQYWAVQQNIRPNEEIWLAALLFNQTAWHLIWHDPEPIAQLTKAVLGNRPSHLAERRLFGATLYDLSGRWAQWQTPVPLLLQTLEKKHAVDFRSLLAMGHGDTEQVLRWSSRPQLLVIAANRASACLMRSGSDAWKHMRWLSAVLKIEPDRAWHDLVDRALFTAQNTALLHPPARQLTCGLDHTPIRHLSMPWHVSGDDIPAPAPVAATIVKTQKTEVERQAASVQVEPSPAPESVREHPDTHFISRFVDQLQQYTNLNQQLQHMVQSWHKDIAIPRIALLVFTADRSALRMLMQRGWDEAAQLSALRWETKDNPLITALTRQASFLVVDGHDAGKYLPYLPQPLVGMLKLPSLLASIKVGDRPIGLIVADCAGNNLSARQLQACRISLPALQKAIERLRRETASQSNA